MKKAKINLIISVTNPESLAEMLKDIQAYCRAKNCHGGAVINETTIEKFEISDTPFVLED